MHQPTRRSFVTSAAAGLTALATSSRVLGANEDLCIACIGTGGRCRHLMQALVRVPGVRIVALCDIWDVALEQARKLAPGATTTKRYKDVLDQKDVDAVLIGSPDHWHVPMTVDACAAGKDVYVEKPLTHNPDEGKAVIEAQGDKRIVQVGMQQRSMPHLVKAKELIQAGRLGKVYKAHLTWNRNSDRVRKNKLGVDPASVDWPAFLGSARKQDFDEYRFRNWRWFWDFGGGLFTDLMVHWIDVVHWFLDIDKPPQLAVAVGNHFTSKGVWETPDTVQTVLSYPGGLQAYFEGTFCNARNGAMCELMGTDATLYIDRGRYELHPERGKGAYEELVLGSGKRGADFYDKPDGELLHLTNWVECVKSRKRPAAPAEAGVLAAAAAHRANQALRASGMAAWKER